jgi:hypothetical protein
MYRNLTPIAVLGASLVLAAPAAFGKDQPVVQQDPATEAVVLRGEALGRAYRDDPTLFGQQDPATLAVVLRGEALGRAYRNDPTLFGHVAARRTTRSDDHFLANDNRFRTKPVNEPTQVTVSSSGTEIEWSQIGIGLGIGILLMLGLTLAVRATRHPPLAH